MTTNELIGALIPADMLIRFGKPMTDAERAAAGKALGVVRTLDGKARVSIHEAVVAGSKFCAAA